MTSGAEALTLARVAARRHRDPLLALPGVVAVGAGHRTVAGRDTGEPAVVIFVVEKKAPRDLTRGNAVPRSLTVDDLETTTDVVEAGRLTAPPHNVAADPPSPDVLQLRGFARPANGGSSAAHYRFPIGTLSMSVPDTADPGGRLAISCNHVFGLLGGAAAGDPILAPAPADDGSQLTGLGTFLRAAPLALDGKTWSHADAALARCRPGACGEAVAGLGIPAGVRRAEDIVPGEHLWKTGRSTGLTEGLVTAVGAHARVEYSSLGFPGAAVLMSEVIMTSPMAAYGDSGALLWDARGQAVGILFGGTAKVTLYNTLPAVLSGLGLRRDPTAEDD